MINVTPLNIRTWALLGQRGTFGKTLFDMAATNDRIYGMTADQAALLGLSRFAKQYPDRYLNMGISEQNAVGVAAGLASEGFVPFLAFQAAFASMRCADQVHVSMAYMKLNVKLVGIFTGLTQGECGPTHMGLHDMALYRSFPNITVLSPSDAGQLVKMMQAAAELDGPVYLRIGGPNDIPIVYKQDFEFKIGKAITLQEGSDIAIIATGSMTHAALKAAELLSAEGLSVKVVDMHTVKPLDLDAVKAACEAKMLITIEEHAMIGGLGSAVAEAIALEKKRPPHLLIGVPDNYPHAGSYQYLLEQTGLTPEKIAQKIKTTYWKI